MADIQTGRFGRLIQSVFNLKQRMTLGQTLPDVMPVFSLDQVAAENKLHVSEGIASAYVTQAAVAAQLSRCALQLPLSSGKVAIVEEMHVWAGSTIEVRVHLTAGTFGSDAGTLEQWCDTRMPGRPVCTTRSNTAAGALGGALASYQLGNAAPLRITQPFVLGNGLLTGVPVASALVIEAETVNVQLTVTFRWRERLLEPQENVLS